MDFFDKIVFVQFEDPENNVHSIDLTANSCVRSRLFSR